MRAQLCGVSVVQTAAAIAFGTASGAHLKALVLPDRPMAANSRLETTNWISQTTGAPLGGLRALFCNAMLYGGPVMMTSALLAVRAA